jgi:hypothetical protein
VKKQIKMQQKRVKLYINHEGQGLSLNEGTFQKVKLSNFLMTLFFFYLIVLGWCQIQRENRLNREKAKASEEPVGENSYISVVSTIRVFLKNDKKHEFFIERVALVKRI